MYICIYYSKKFSKPDWRLWVLANSCLTEDDFVNYMLLSLQQAVHAKAHFVTAAVTMQNLRLSRPERILPDLLEN